MHMKPHRVKDHSLLHSIVAMMSNNAGFDNPLWFLSHPNFTATPPLPCDHALGFGITSGSSPVPGRLTGRQDWQPSPCASPSRRASLPIAARSKKTHHDEGKRPSLQARSVFRYPQSITGGGLCFFRVLPNDYIPVARANGH